MWMRGSDGISQGTANIPHDWLPHRSNRPGSRRRKSNWMWAGNTMTGYGTMASHECDTLGIRSKWFLQSIWLEPARSENAHGMENRIIGWQISLHLVTQMNGAYLLTYRYHESERSAIDNQAKYKDHNKCENASNYVILPPEIENIAKKSINFTSHSHSIVGSIQINTHLSGSPFRAPSNTSGVLSVPCGSFLANCSTYLSSGNRSSSESTYIYIWK